MEVEALLFDVFGTVVDWRTSIARQLEAFLAPRGVERDWDAMARDWRARYQSAMAAVRTGRRPFVKLDLLHSENLVGVLEELGIAGLTDAEIDSLNRICHRLDPWPDVVPGLARLSTAISSPPARTAMSGSWSTSPGMAACPGMPCSAPRSRGPTSHSPKPIWARPPSSTFLPRPA